MGAGGSTQTPKRHDRRSRGSRDSEDTGSTASAFGRGDRERCLLHAQALDRHASLLPDHARRELEALITTLEHGRVYDDDDDSKASSLNDLQHFAPHPNEKVQTWLRTTLCTDQEGRDARKSKDVSDARTSVTGLPSTFLLNDARTSVSTLRGSQTDIIAAAAAGDLEALRRTPKERIDDGDYDQRTALHLAASNGRLTVVACLVDELGANVSPVDRWGGTPLDDAVRHSHSSVREFLEGKGALRGVSQPGEWDEGADLCDAAKKGDMSRLRRLALQKQKGCDQADYDGRCALHLASCAGRLDVVKLLVEELGAALEVTDRWGGTPLDDAEREGHTSVVEYLSARGAPRGHSRRSRHTRATLDELPEELDDVDVQVRVTEAWLAALKERRYVEEFDADAECDDALPSFTSVDAFTEEVQFDIDSWEYDVIRLHEQTGGHALAAVGPILLRRHSLIDRCSLDPKVVQNFFAAVEANYGGNPYHNAVHAADVAVAVHLFLSEHDLMEARFADPVACLAVLLAGVVHDFAHPGTTNPHEVKTSSKRHKAFGDAGILEKFHVRAAFALMRDPKLNILAPLDHTGYARARRAIVKAVLATDLGRHMTYVERLNEMAMTEGARSHNTRVNSINEWKSPFLDPEKCGRDLVAAVALKFADLGHACKKRILHEEWTERITNEFWNLGERERSLNVAISPLCDRQTDVDVAKSQVGFFSFICMPFYTVVADLVDPDMLPLSRLKQNLRYWQTKKHARRWEAAAKVAGPLRRPA